MNRERKYRAWLPAHQKMVYSSNTGDDDTIFLILPSGIIVQTLEIIDKCPGGMYHEQSEEWETAPDAEIMDFTGLKDKNGKEVFEGNIVKVLSAKSGHKKQSLNTGIIEWGKTGMPGFTVTLVIDGERWAYGFIDHRTLEVVGNICENPDLLK